MQPVQLYNCFSLFSWFLFIYLFFILFPMKVSRCLPFWGTSKSFLILDCHHWFYLSGEVFGHSYLQFFFFIYKYIKFFFPFDNHTWTVIYTNIIMCFVGLCWKVLTKQIILLDISWLFARLLSLISIPPLSLGICLTWNLTETELCISKVPRANCCTKLVRSV